MLLLHEGDCFNLDSRITGQARHLARLTSPEDLLSAAIDLIHLVEVVHVGENTVVC